MRVLLLLPLVMSSCALAVNGERLWGADRVDDWVDAFGATACERFASCDDEAAIGSCESQVLASMGNHDGCRFDRRSASQCLDELEPMTCGGTVLMPNVCFEVLQNCDAFIPQVFFQDTDFDL